MFETLAASGPHPRSVPHRYVVSAGIHALALAGAIALARQPARVETARLEPHIIPFAVEREGPSPPAEPLAAAPLSDGPPATAWSPDIDVNELGPKVDELRLPTVGDILDRVNDGEGGFAPAGRISASGRVSDALRAEAVDEPVAVLHQPAPRYPAALASAGVNGRIQLEYIVDTLGRAEPGSVRTIGDAHPALADAARESILASRYRPARLRGAAVRQLVRQAIVFRVEIDGRPR